MVLATIDTIPGGADHLTSNLTAPTKSPSAGDFSPLSATTEIDTAAFFPDEQKRVSSFRAPTGCPEGDEDAAAAPAEGAVDAAAAAAESRDAAIAAPCDSIRSYANELTAMSGSKSSEREERREGAPSEEVEAVDVPVVAAAAQPEESSEPVVLKTIDGPTTTQRPAVETIDGGFAAAADEVPACESDEARLDANGAMKFDRCRSEATNASVEVIDFAPPTEPEAEVEPKVEAKVEADPEADSNEARPVAESKEEKEAKPELGDAAATETPEDVKLGAEEEKAAPMEEEAAVAVTPAESPAEEAAANVDAPKAEEDAATPGKKKKFGLKKLSVSKPNLSVSKPNLSVSKPNLSISKPNLSLPRSISSPTRGGLRQGLSKRFSSPMRPRTEETEEAPAAADDSTPPPEAEAEGSESKKKKFGGLKKKKLTMPGKPTLGRKAKKSEKAQAKPVVAPEEPAAAPTEKLLPTGPVTTEDAATKDAKNKPVEQETEKKSEEPPDVAESADEAKESKDAEGNNPEAPVEAETETKESCSAFFVQQNNSMQVKEEMDKQDEDAKDDQSLGEVKVKGQVTEVVTKKPIIEEEEADVEAETSEKKATDVANVAKDDTAEKEDNIIEMLCAKAEKYMGDVANLCGPMGEQGGSVDKKKTTDLVESKSKDSMGSSSESKKADDTTTKESAETSSAPADVVKEEDTDKTESEDAKKTAGGDDGAAHVPPALDTTTPINAPKGFDIFTPLSVATDKVGTSSFMETLNENLSMQSIVVSINQGVESLADMVESLPKVANDAIFPQDAVEAESLEKMAAADKALAAETQGKNEEKGKKRLFGFMKSKPKPQIKVSTPEPGAAENDGEGKASDEPDASSDNAPTGLTFISRIGSRVKKPTSAKPISSGNKNKPAKQAGESKSSFGFGRFKKDKKGGNKKEEESRAVPSSEDVVREDLAPEPSLSLNSQSLNEPQRSKEESTPTEDAATAAVVEPSSPESKTVPSEEPEASPATEAPAATTTPPDNTEEPETKEIAAVEPQTEGSKVEEPKTESV